MTTEHMPSYRSVEDILNFLEVTHRNAANLLQNAQKSVSEEKLSLLLEVLGKKQRALSNFYADRSGMNQQILTTWIQYLPDRKIVDDLYGAHRLEDAPQEDLPERLVDLQNGIAEFLETLTHQVHSQDLRPFFESYLTRERSETSLCSRAVLGEFDM